MKQTKLRVIGIFILIQAFLLIASPFLGKLLPFLAVVAAWVWFVLPGFLLTYLIKKPVRWVDRVPIGFALSVGFGAPFTIGAILLRLSLNMYMLVTLAAFALGLLVFYYFGSIPEGGMLAGGSEEDSAVSLFERGMQVVLVVVVVLLMYLALTWPPAGDDLAGLPLYAEVLGQDKIIGEEPFHGTGTPVTPRNELVVWGYQTILLAKMGDIDPTDLLVGSRGVLIVFSFMGVFSFVSQWFDDRKFARLVAILWGVYLLGSLQFDGDGSNFVTRIFQDKFLGWFLIIPVLLVLFLWYVEDGSRRVMILLAVGAFGIAMMHPVTFTILLMMIAAYSLLHLVFHWSRSELMKFVWLAIALGLCLVVPVIQYVRYMGPMPIEMAGLGGAVDFSRYRMAAGRFRLFLLDSGGHILHPKVITQQFVLLGLVGSIFLVGDARKNKGTRLVIASLILLTVVLYIPILAFLVGKFVTPFLIWRLAWPYSLLAILALAQAVLKGIRWIAEKIKAEKIRQSLIRFQPVVVVVTAVLIALPNIQYGFSNHNERLTEQYYTICAKAEGALAHAGNLAADASINLLAAQKINLCIPGSIGLANVIEYRGLGTVNRLPFEELDASYQRVEDSDYFTNATWVDDRIITILETYEIEYLLASKDRMAFSLQLRFLPDHFELVYEDSEFLLFSVHQPVSPSRIFDGNAALRTGSWEEAKGIFENVLIEAPDDLLAALGLAEAHAGLGDYERSLEILLEAARNYPEEAEIQVRLADNFLVLRNIAMAAKHYQAARDLAPDRGEIYYSVGSSLFLLGDEQLALDSYEAGAAHFAEPGTANYFSEIARQLVYHRWYSQAVPYYQQAVDVSATVELYIDYAEALYQSGNSAEAIMVCEEAIRLDRWHYLPYYQLGKLYMSRNRLTQAKEMFYQALWLNPTDTSVYVDLAEVLQSLDGVESAVAEIQGMIRGSREMPGPAAGLIPLYIMQGDQEAALQQYDQLRLLIPRSTAIEVSQGFLLVDTGDYDLAAEMFQKALEDHPELISPAMGLAKLYALEDDRDAELEQRLQITRKIPLSAWPHISLGVAFNRQGEWTKALEELRFAVELNPEWASAHSALADYYYGRGEWDLALESYMTAIELGAEDSTILNSIAQVYWRLDELDTAEEYLLQAIEFDPMDSTARLELTKLYWQQGMAGQSMSALDNLRDLGLTTINDIQPMVEAYLMQGRVDQVAAIYSEIITSGQIYAEFPDWTDPNMPLLTDNEYALAVLEEIEKDPASITSVLRGAANFYLSMGQQAKAEEVLLLSLTLPPGEDLDYIALSELRLNQGNRGGAFSVLSQGMEAFPGSGAIYNKAGEIYLQYGDYALAVESFEQAMAVDPSYATAWINRSEMYRANGEFEKAAELLAAIAQEYPASLELILTLASLDQYSGELESSEQRLLQANLLSPTDAVVALELASLYQKQRNFFAAEHYLAAALSLEPLDSEVYLALGDYLESISEDAKALSAYQTAVNVDQGATRPRLSLAEYYRKNGDYSLAEEVLLETISAQPGNPEGYLALGNLLLQTHDYEEAVENFQSICEIDRDNIGCFIGQGQAAAAQGNQTLAEEMFSQALAINPASRDALLSSAEMYRLEGDYTEAERMFSLAIETGLEKANVYYERASFYQQAGNFEAAEEDFQAALTYWPGGITIGVDYARLLKQTGQFETASEILGGLASEYSLTCSVGIELADVYAQQLIFTEAIDIYEGTIVEDPYCVDAYQGLAQIFRAVGDIDGVIETYQRAVTASPDNPRAYVNLGNAYVNNLEFELAEIAFERALSLDSRNLSAMLALEKMRLIQHQEGEFEFLSLEQYGRDADPDYLVVFGLLYQEYNQWEKAYEYLVQVLEEDSNNAMAWYGLGNHYANLLDWAAAVDAYQTALKITPDTIDYLLGLGEAQTALEETALAEQTYRQLLAYFPGKADAYLALADLYVLAETPELAEEILVLGTQNAPSDSRVYEALGRMYINQKRFNEVEAVFTSGLDAIPGAPNLYAGLGDYYSWSINGLVEEVNLAEATVWWYGYLMRRLENFEGSITSGQSRAFAERSQEINRLYQDGLNKLAAVRRTLANSNDDIESAREAYQAALSLNPGNEGALLGLARLEITSGNEVEGLAYYQRAVEANPNSTISLNRLGFAYLNYGDPQSALPLFERSVSLEPDETLSLIGRFRALIELDNWNIETAALATEGAQFWWGDLVDRLRITAFAETQLNPYAGSQELMDNDEVEITLDIPQGWEAAESLFDYSLVRTYTSPDGGAKIQMVVFDDSKSVNRNLAMLFSLVLLDETYTGNLYVQRNEVLSDRENLYWFAEENGYSGVTGFTINQGSLVILTTMIEDEFLDEYYEQLSEISLSIQLGDPVYP